VLIHAARTLFAENGFSATGTEEIVRAAGVTRGALYHQFEDKTALFVAVFHEVERDWVAQVVQEIAGIKDPVEALRCGCDAFLSVCCDAEIRRIALIDAPSVLGWQRWRELDATYGLGLLRQVLDAIADAGEIEHEWVPELAHLLLGALGEAAMVVGHAPEDDLARERVRLSLRWMVDRLISNGKE